MSKNKLKERAAADNQDAKDMAKDFMDATYQAINGNAKLSPCSYGIDGNKINLSIKDRGDFIITIEKK